MSGSPFELKPVVCRAGAGAGKTTRLVSQVIDVAENFKKTQGRWPKMVVTTFTRKATQELRERLLEEGRKRNQPELIQFLLSKSDLHISTIHGVLHLFLTRFGSRAGLDPSFRFVEPNESRKRDLALLRQVILNNPEAEVLLADLKFSDLLGLVRAYSREMLLEPEMRCLSHKDLVIEAQTRITELAAVGQAVGKAVLSNSSDEKWIAFGKDILEYSKNLKWDDGGILLADGLAAPRTKKGAPDDSITSSAKAWLSEVKDLEGPFFDPAEIKGYSEKLELIEKVGREFALKRRQLKVTTGLLEVDDLETLTLELLREAPDCGERFAQEKDYWLIDEFQDTSPLQVEVLRRLIGSKPFFLVGDPQQSIYSFRGARSQVFDEEEARVLALGGEHVLLERNYRSEPNLLLYINELSQQLGFREMKPRDEQFALPIPVVADWGLAESDEDEFDFIGQKIVGLIQGGAAPESICILARQNKTLVEMAAYLESKGVSTQLHSAAGFSERREILDLISLLKFLVNPHDDLNLFELLRSPWFRIADETLAALAQKKYETKAFSFWAILKTEPEVSGRLVSGLKRVEEWGVLSSFEFLVLESGIVDFSHYHDATGQRESNIWKFLMRLREASLEPGFNPLVFARSMSSSLSLDEVGEDGDAVAAFAPNRVNLMTVHMSKGLQFDYVFIPRIGADQSHAKTKKFVRDIKKWACQLPLGPEAKFQGPELVEREKLRRAEYEKEEQARLLYVAMTRAKKRLFFSHGEKRGKSSWLRYFAGTLPSPGLRQSEFFGVRCESGPWKVEPLISALDQQVSPRSKWKTSTVLAPEAAQSVTDLIQGVGASQSSVGFEKQAGSLLKRVGSSARGVLFHRILESIQYVGVAAARNLLTEFVNESDSQARSAFEFVASDQNLLSLVESGHVEYGFLWRVGAKTIEGQIDLWGSLGDEIWVVDYKTGSQEGLEKAFLQLEIYATALYSSGCRGRYQLVVVYPFDGQIEKREFSDFKKWPQKMASESVGDFR